MFGDAVNTIKAGLGQEFRSTLSTLHLSLVNQKIFKEAVDVFNLFALVKNCDFQGNLEEAYLLPL